MSAKKAKSHGRKKKKPGVESVRPARSNAESGLSPSSETHPILVLTSDEGFGSIIGEITQIHGFESRVLPLAGFSPSEVIKKKYAAIVDCRSYFGVAQKVVKNLHELHPELPILTIIDGDERESDERDRMYGSGATICISNKGGKEVLGESIQLLIRLTNSSERTAVMEEMLNARNIEILNLRNEMNANQYQLAKRVQEQITVYRAARAMLSVFDFDDLANEILRLATTELGAEIGSLMLIEGDELVVRALYGHIPGEDPILGRRQKIGEGVSGWVAREGKPLLIEDIETHSKFEERGGVRYKSKSAVSCPIIARGRIRGVININNKRDTGHFVEDDLRLLRTLAMTAAVALDNFELIEQMRQSETMSRIGELATRMAHEIRNPLHAIKMNIQILGKKFPMDADDKEYYDILIGEINRLENLVKDVLSFARQDKMQMVSCDLSRIAEHTIAILKSLLDEKNIDLYMDLASGLPLVEVDEDKIQQTLINLIVNSVEAMPEGGDLYIATGVVIPFIYPKSHYGEKITDTPDVQHHQYAVISIRDTGAGIDRDKQDKIFNPFFTTKIDGTGLGLSTTRKIIEAHGGNIHFESRPDKGTTFRIELPIPENSDNLDIDISDEAEIVR